MKKYGYNGKILHIDLTSRTSYCEEMDETWYRTYAGGGLLGTYFLLRDTPVGLDAYDPRNLLIFTSSIIAGLDGPGLARFSVVSKSPLSQGIAETRCEGPWGQWLKGSGYDALIFSGASQTPVYVEIKDKEVLFHDADALWGNDTYKTTKVLEEKYGEQSIEVAAIGQAGENLVRYASIVTGYSIQCMRMGVGAVMGSKKLKAVVLNGKELPEVNNPSGLEDLKKDFEEKMRRNQLSKWQKEAPGFSASADLSDFETAYIGTNNYCSNLRVEQSHYTRDKYMEYYKGEKSCPGCPNGCIKFIDTGIGYAESTGIHQEVTGSMGANIGNGNLKLMLETNVLCNLFGLDPVSLGFTLSFAMECFEKGIINKSDTDGIEYIFGNEDDLKQIIHTIVHREGFGDILAEGSKRAAERIGRQAEKYALHVKGIEMVSFEPRTQTNLALGYATAPIGPRYDICEHDWDFDVVSGWEHTLEHSRTLGILERIGMEYVGNDKVKNYKALNNIWSACDTLDLCVFASAPTRILNMEMIADLIHVITGWDTSSYEFMRWGERRNHLMRVYNLREGLSKDDDTLPDKFFDIPISYGRLEGTVIDRSKFMQAISLYYEMMGWDNRGIPFNGTLYDYNLQWVLPVVKKIREMDKKS